MRRFELINPTKGKRPTSKRAYYIQCISDTTGLEFRQVLNMLWHIPPGEKGLQIIQEIYNLVNMGDTKEIRKERFYNYRYESIAPSTSPKIEFIEEFGF